MVSGRSIAASRLLEQQQETWQWEWTARIEFELDAPLNLLNIRREKTCGEVPDPDRIEEVDKEPGRFPKAVPDLLLERTQGLLALRR